MILSKEVIYISCRIAQLRHKEVINECDGALLGCVDDVEIDTKNASLSAMTDSHAALIVSSTNVRNAADLI